MTGETVVMRARVRPYLAAEFRELAKKHGMTVPAVAGLALDFGFDRAVEFLARENEEEA